MKAEMSLKAHVKAQYCQVMLVVKSVKPKEYRMMIIMMASTSLKNLPPKMLHAPSSSAKLLYLFVSENCNHLDDIHHDRFYNDPICHYAQ